MILRMKNMILFTTYYPLDFWRDICSPRRKHHTPRMMKGMLSSWPMSKGMEFSKSTWLIFRNSTKKRKVKI